MATPLMTAMNPTDPNKSFGQSVAENVPSTMGQMALMSGWHLSPSSFSQQQNVQSRQHTVQYQ